VYTVMCTDTTPPPKIIGESRFADCLIDGRFAGSVDIEFHVN